jgi:CubicO group peptidase (beta-lactamase class C family)
MISQGETQVIHKRLPTFLALFLLCFSITHSVAAQTANPTAPDEKVDELVKQQMQARKIPAVSIVVLKNGEVVKAKGYGFANLEHQVAAKPETIYQSGSVGKQFTATLAMMLVEEGKLGLDDKINKYLTPAPEAWKEITVRHLLTHTSGISNKLYNQMNMRADYTEDELLQKISAIPLDFQPGEKWNYSNPGYVTLGILIHKVSGKFYGDLLQEKIFKPLGMSTARVINEAEIIANRAAGYRLVKGEVRNQEWVSPALNTTADGSLYLTVLDMAKWDAALYGEKLLKKASLEQMWTPVKLNSGKTQAYGFGWSFSEINGHKIIEHGGAWQGFTTFIARYVNDKLSVIVLTNLAGADPGKIAHGIAGIYNPELTPPAPPGLPNSANAKLKIDSKILDAYVGEYELKPGFTLNIRREGENLFGQATGQSEFQLYPESATRFFLQVAGIKIEFFKDADDKVSHLVLYQNGEHQAKKIK